MHRLSITVNYQIRKLKTINIYNCGHSGFSYLNSKKVIDALQAGEVGSAKKRMRKLEYPDLDDAMDKWYEKTINTTKQTKIVLNIDKIAVILLIDIL